MDKYFGFFADLIHDFPTYIEEQEFYYGDTVELYDQICGGQNEFPMFMQAIALHGGPVLDLCCGSGRLTIPAAKLGTDVTGVDLSGDMLKKLEENLNLKNKRLKNRVHLYRQDMTKLELPGRYGVIMIGATSIRLLDGSFKDFFDSLYDYVQAGGCLCFDMEDLPQTDMQTIKIDDTIAASLPDSSGRLSVILFQRAVDYAESTAHVNMAKILPGTTQKILLTSTKYRIFGIDDIKSAAEDSKFGGIEITGFNAGREYFCKLVK